MEKVFALQHSYGQESGYDETKFIGVYSSETEAQSAIERFKLQPGFCDRPNDFCIDKYELNKDYWTEGYSSVTTMYVINNTREWIPVSSEISSDGTGSTHLSFLA